MHYIIYDDKDKKVKFIPDELVTNDYENGFLEILGYRDVRSFGISPDLTSSEFAELKYKLGSLDRDKAGKYLTCKSIARLFKRG